MQLRNTLLTERLTCAADGTGRRRTFSSCVHTYLEKTEHQAAQSCLLIHFDRKRPFCWESMVEGRRTVSNSHAAQIKGLLVKAPNTVQALPSTASRRKASW
ncbi:hypothetical protein VTO42DRAFT_4491 [Malbranchea cinnamomea]